MTDQIQNDPQVEDRTTLMMSRLTRHKIRNAIFHKINAERTKLEMLEDKAHEPFPIGHDEEKPFSSHAVCAMFDLLGMKLQLGQYDKLFVEEKEVVANVDPN